ncbi:unnamed protein product [Oncorhynchus mykiss]|uniref:Uncharacterized protein n=1 Tax=Oncorhynchus mykiss TaxID=8022 RepID=A0A060X4N9_ONCMY|nr:unnamed protein product [Oncorhynchus mykiss]
MHILASCPDKISRLKRKRFFPKMKILPLESQQVLMIDTWGASIIHTLFLSLSLSLSLSLCACGKTRRDMETALCLSHDFFCVHSEMKKLKLKLHQDTLKMASQIYYNPNKKLSESNPCNSTMQIQSN